MTEGIRDGVGRVLGTQHTSTREFRVVLDEDEYLQLDDLVVVRTQVPKAGEVRTYGIVTEAEARAAEAASPLGVQATPYDPDPTAAFEGFASVQISTTDFGGAYASSPASDVDAVTIEVGDLNTAPVNTVPSTLTLDPIVQNCMLVFSSTRGTAITSSASPATRPS